MRLRDCAVHITGLGLMGASLALALRGKTAALTGSDIQKEVEKAALRDGVIDRIDGPSQADLVILAAPPEAILRLIPHLELKAGAVVMDLGSTKQRICDALDQLPDTLHAVGGHPMCGLAENGYSNALPTLYAGARFILCETERTNDHARNLAEQVIAAVGALPLWMPRAEHDQVAGAISHLPHLLSFVLMRIAMQMAKYDASVYELAAGGFDGATRLARTDETMITGMFLTNAEQLRSLVNLMHQHLDDLTSLLDSPEELSQELGEIVAARRAYTRRYGERMIT